MGKVLDAYTGYLQDSTTYNIAMCSGDTMEIVNYTGTITSSGTSTFKFSDLSNPYQYQYNQLSLTGQHNTTPTTPKEEPKVKANGKEFLVFKKGLATPLSSHTTRADAVEEATDLSMADDGVYYIYAPVAKISPSKTDTKVTDL